MIANILPTDISSTPRVGSKGLKEDMLYVKLKGIEHRAQENQTPSTPGMGQKVKYFFFSESGNVAYQINVKEVQTNMQAKSRLYTHPWPFGLG